MVLRYVDGPAAGNALDQNDRRPDAMRPAIG
jgi:hypothetical protein